MPDFDDDTSRDWLRIAREAYQSSTSYLDANWRKQWETNLALFKSRHPPGSKYHSDAYKKRSRIFRPKTRSVVRKNEAAAAAAFFSNIDVVSVEPENENDPVQLASAAVMKQLLNYRLQKTIPWFMVLIGALQDAQVYGVVCAYLHWRYEARTVSQPVEYVDELGQPLLDETGQPIIGYQPEVEVSRDEPAIELLPPENYRFDPGANWLDVVGSSPYFIRMVPVYVGDVKARMRQADPKTGQPAWRELSDGEIRQAKAEYDTIRQAREDGRQDPVSENEAPLSDFEIVWVHENFVRIDGEEVVYWTMGTQHLLTDPVPLREAYWTGRRPFVIGTCAIEAHQPVPAATVELTEQLQRELNDVANQRMDNVKLVLNKRWIVARNKNVDVQSLIRNVPGAVTMTDAPADVVPVDFADVTASSYQEQDRLAVEFDELAGNFSGSSVQSNRKLNETVGGMSLLSGSASMMTEYLLRTFTETWVEPVLRVLVQLEQQYETDQTVLALAGERAKLQQRYGMDQVTDELLNQSLTVRVNVGIGATDPNTKLQKFLAATDSYGKIVANLPGVDAEQVRREIYGLAGYRDGGRFFKDAGTDPASAQLQQAQAALQQLVQQIQQLQAENAQLKQAKAADLIQALADADLKQAQTTKTLVEANLMPSQAMVQQAIAPEQTHG